MNQPPRISSPGAVGRVHLQRACFTSDEAVQLVQTGILKMELNFVFFFLWKSDISCLPCEVSHLIVMNPSDRVERCDLSDLLWQLISAWPLLRQEIKEEKTDFQNRVCRYFLDVSFTLFMVPGSRQWQEWSWFPQQGQPRSQSRAGRPPNPCLRPCWLRYW